MLQPTDHTLQDLGGQYNMLALWAYHARLCMKHVVHVLLYQVPGRRRSGGVGWMQGWAAVIA